MARHRILSGLPHDGEAADINRDAAPRREIGLAAGLRYVYEGNIPGSGENTHCHHCGAVLIERYGFFVRPIASTTGAASTAKRRSRDEL